MYLAASKKCTCFTRQTEVLTHRLVQWQKIEPIRGYNQQVKKTSTNAWLDYRQPNLLFGDTIEQVHFALQAKKNYFTSSKVSFAPYANNTLAYKSHKVFKSPNCSATNFLSVSYVYDTMRAAIELFHF